MFAILLLFAFVLSCRRVNGSNAVFGAHACIFRCQRENLTPLITQSEREEGTQTQLDDFESVSFNCSCADSANHCEGMKSGEVGMYFLSSQFRHTASNAQHPRILGAVFG